MTEEHIETRSKKGRGMAQASLDLIEAMHDDRRGRAADHRPRRRLQAVHRRPDRVDGTSDMQRVYRLLKEARERGIIPWEWIVDETRELEKRAELGTIRPNSSALCSRSYRRDFWNQQPVRVEVWSEKGTVRGVLQPVLDEYGVGFRVMHGFSGATRSTTLPRTTMAATDRPLCRRLRSERHVHVGARPARAAR